MPDGSIPERGVLTTPDAAWEQAAAVIGPLAARDGSGWLRRTSRRQGNRRLGETGRDDDVQVEADRKW